MIMRIRRKELARMLGVSVTTVSSWKSRYSDFPQPVGRYYDLVEVQRWKEKHDHKESVLRKDIHRSTA